MRILAPAPLRPDSTLRHAARDLVLGVLGCAAAATWATPAHAALTFTPSCFASHASITDETADFNEDGFLDMVLANDAISTSGSPILGSDLEVYLGRGDGTFRPPLVLSGANSAAVVDFIAADVDNDGHLDLVTANLIGTVTVYRGRGDGTFAAKINYGAGYSLNGVVAADFNRDGRMDLVAGDGGKPRIAVLLGTGKGGSFKDRVQYDTGFTVRGLAATDLNGDGLLDVVTVNNAANSILGTTLSVMLGNGDGTFQPFYLVNVPRFVGRNLIATDFDQDGRVDLVLGSQDFGDSGVQTLRGHGDGTFDPAVYTVTSTNGAFPSSSLDVAVGDLNGDGRPDVVACNRRFDAVGVVAQDLTVLLDQPGGSLVIDGTTPVAFARGVVIADWNRDGLQDIANDGCVLLQNAGPAPLALGAARSPGAATPREPSLALSFAPVPWREGGRVTFSLPRAGRVSLGLFDLGGRLVASLVDGVELAAGEHQLQFAHRPADAAPGVYFYRLWTEQGAVTRRVVLTAR